MDTFMFMIIQFVFLLGRLSIFSNELYVILGSDLLLFH